MKISWNWLSDYIDIGDYRSQPEELGKILTAAGLEIEGIDDTAQKYKNVVIGKLITVDKHPDADKLTLCQVDIGQATTAQIICGAKNHKAGDYVVAALPGAILPGDFAIKISKIRGVESQGMLCSTKELGLDQEGDGILIYKEGQPGQSFAEKQGLNDIILEVNVTPNRADCLSHLGLAMELSALLKRPFRRPKIELTRSQYMGEVDVTIEEPERCARFAGCVVKTVKVGPSPAWMKQRLEAVGLRSINNLVDITNYVMLEYGQPMHAYDLREIKGGKIIVRLSKKGETFTTLDGTELTLTGDELMIADKERPVGIAGVIGGKNSGISDATTDIFFEAAYFNSQTVRRTSRRFGIDTDASYRFSRGVNPQLTTEALDRACELLQKVSQGGEVARISIDRYPHPIERKPITVDVAYVAQRLGYAISESEFAEEMKRLGCDVNGNQVTPPAQRGDITIPEDLVEEYARLNGYDRLVEKLPVLSSEPTLHATDYLLSQQVGATLSGLGASQAVNYAFVNKALHDKVLAPLETYQKFGFKASAPIALKNPITEDFAVMRTSLLPSLLNNVSHNIRHGNLNGQIFEIGPSFHTDGKTYGEEKRLALLAWGQDSGVWGKNQPPVYRLKAMIDNLLEVFVKGSGKWEWVTAEKTIGLFHPSQVVQLMWRGKSVGVLGSLHPQISKEQKLRGSVAFAELNFDEIFKAKKTHRFVPLSAFPSVEKDLTFVMPKSMKSQAVIKEITKAGGQLLSSARVVDLFEGEALGSDKKALSFRMIFQSSERTLSDEEVLKLMNVIIDSVSQKLSIQLR
ncbi:MAG: phenylalanine--tRNA ligase subunit beta [Bdellovibrionales bacterium]|nr:phenylalanine--tRNA ligase subunit beta [Bdellovibrionales bacterium]